MLNGFVTVSKANVVSLDAQQLFKKSFILHVMLKSKHCKLNLLKNHFHYWKQISGNA